MKLIVTGCWHLGKRIGGYDLHNDIKETAFQVIDATQSADLFVHLGDLFDSNKPSPADYTTAIGLINELGCPGLFLPGNHDPDTLYPLVVAKQGGAFSKSTVFAVAPGQYRVGEDGEKQVLCIGHPPREWKQPNVDTEFERARMSHEDEWSSRQARVEAVFTHLNAEGVEIGEGVRMGPTDLSIPMEAAKKLPCPVFAGHIHKEQFIAPNIYFPGSLVRADMGERDQKKCFIEAVI